MSHVAMTGIARYFRRERGKALALASLGHALGEAILSAAAVTLIAWWGWRSTLGAAGAAVLLLTGAAMLLVRHRPRFRRLDAGAAPEEPGQVAHHAATGRGPGLGAWLMVTPAIMATPLFTTALIFHQALIADAKGMPLHWFAFAFVGFACARIAGSLLGGPAIDRWGARVLLPPHLVPLGAGVAVLALGAGPWSIALYMLLAGLGAGASGTLVTALVAELVPPARLGAVRSLLAALMVVSTAIGPAVYGWLYAWGVSVPALLWGSLAALAAAALAAASPAVRENRSRDPGPVASRRSV